MRQVGLDARSEGRVTTASQALLGVLGREGGSEGLSGEWTVVGRPSTEVVLASSRQADPPGEAMELLRFALGAPPQIPGTGLPAVVNR